MYVVSILFISLVVAFAPLPDLYEHRNTLTLGGSHTTQPDQIAALLRENKDLETKNKEKDVTIADNNKRIEELEKRKPINCSEVEKKLSARDAEVRLLKEQLDQEKKDHRDTDRNLTTCMNEKDRSNNKLDVMLLRNEMEDIKKRFKYEIKNPASEKQDEEKGLSSEAIAWKRLAESKSEEKELRIIRDELKRLNITPKQFGITASQLWEFLCDQVHHILSNPDTDLEPIAAVFPERFFPEVIVINKLFGTKKVYLRGKSAN